MPLVDTGTGAALVFTTSSWTAEIMSIEHSGVSREAIDVTHLGSTSARAFIPGDLYDPGELDVEYHHNPDNPPPFTATAEIVQIKFPLSGTITTASQDKISMFIVDLGKTIPLEDKMVGTIKLKCTGPISHTNAA